MIWRPARNQSARAVVHLATLKYPDGLQPMFSSDPHLESVIVDRSFLAVCPILITDLYDLWNERRRERVMPMRREFDSVELRKWMGRIIFFERRPAAQSEDDDFIYGAIGADLIRESDCDPTGGPLSRPPMTIGASAALSTLRAVCERRRPHYCNDLNMAWNGSSFSGVRLFLPLSDDEQQAQMVLCFICPPRQSDGAPHQNRRESFWSLLIQRSLEPAISDGGLRI